jgi:hypothetical protein
MKLTIFINNLSDDIEAFNDHWLNGHSKYPNIYPLEMGAEDWWEHFMAYIDSKDEHS